MMTIYGQKGDGPIMSRRVTVGYALYCWRQYFRAIRSARKSNPVVVDDMKVWSHPF